MQFPCALHGVFASAKQSDLGTVLHLRHYRRVSGGGARLACPPRATALRPPPKAPSLYGSILDKTLDSPDIAAARARRDLAFRDDINGLRAVAVLGVVAFHADRALLPGGFAGVDVFFVISGFLITRIILSELAAGRFSLAEFYAKRARRILPAMLVVVAFVWVVGWFRAAPTQFHDIGGTMLGDSYFTVNFWLMRLANIGGISATIRGPSPCCTCGRLASRSSSISSGRC